LNTGIQDAYNLAWKLAMVIHGEAQPMLLDSYSAERRPVAAAVLRGTDAVTQAVMLRHPIGEVARNGLAAFLGQFDFVRQHVARGLSELGVNYRNSPMVAENRTGLISSLAQGIERLGEYLDFGDAPHAGDRAPDVLLQLPGEVAPTRLFELVRGTQHKLLLFPGPLRPSGKDSRLEAILQLIANRYATRIATFLVARGDARPEGIPWEGPVLFDVSERLHHRYGATAECLYLLRPDGYVGYRSLPVDVGKFQAYLERIFA
jgi:hypothetical protein